MSFFSIIPAVGGLYSAIDSYSFLHSFARIIIIFFFFLNQAGFLLQAEEIFTLLDFREHMDTEMTNSAEFSLSDLRAEGRWRVLTLRVLLHLLMLRSSTSAGLSSPCA